MGETLECKNDKLQLWDEIWKAEEEIENSNKMVKFSG